MCQMLYTQPFHVESMLQLDNKTYQYNNYESNYVSYKSIQEPFKLYIGQINKQNL